jgi:signal transduction histidine kinase
MDERRANDRRRTGAIMMRLSLRTQMLIPLLGIQAVAATALTMATVALAASRSEREIVVRLNGVLDTLERASFPYTARVLEQMRGLSRAHFVVSNEDGRVTDSTLPGLATLPADIRSIWQVNRLESLTEASTLIVDGSRYFTVPIRRANGPSRSIILVLYPETSWQQARWEAATPPLAFGLGTLALMAAMTWWIAQSISMRIRKLQQQVARIAGGNFEPLDPAPGSGEIGDLAVSINVMCNQLKQMQTTIRQSERARVLAQLGAGMAHQLRNSLTGARMSIQLHVRRFPPQEGDDTLSVALRQLAMTEEQVRGLLALGRVETQPTTRCEVGQLLAEIERLVHPACQHAKVKLHRHPSEAPVHVMADQAGLRVAVLNLALNAIEAAGPGERVELKASTENGEAVIEVWDTGPGPSPDVQEMLFEAFVTSKPEGVGLGLAVAQQVALGHGGRLSWRRHGGQTQFRLTLPILNGTLKETR